MRMALCIDILVYVDPGCASRLAQGCGDSAKAEAATESRSASDSDALVVAQVLIRVVGVTSFIDITRCVQHVTP